jgi:hypothetical protein
MIRMARKKVKMRAKPDMQTVKAPKIVVTDGKGYGPVYASGVFGGIDPNDARMIFFLDRLKPSIKPGGKGAMGLDRVERELQVEVHMSPHQFLAVAKWMAEHAENFGKRVKVKPRDDAGGASYIG